MEFEIMLLLDVTLNLMHCFETIPYPLKTNTPLKISGRKKKNPSKVVPFQGIC